MSVTRPLVTALDHLGGHASHTLGTTKSVSLLIFLFCFFSLWQLKTYIKRDFSTIFHKSMIKRILMSTLEQRGTQFLSHGGAKTF